MEPGLRGGKCKRVLVVDDSRATRRVIADMLRSISLEVSEAGDGREGLEALRSASEIGLVLVDWNMPEMDGLSFVRVVRDDPAYADVLLMMITTEVQMSKVSEALSAGADEYLMKPFTREMVIEKLALLGLTEATG